MKKDYSFNNLINRLGLNLPNNIGLFCSYIISFLICLIFNCGSFFILLFGFIHSFIGLSIAGSLLDKNCINKDSYKCKNCKCWNCNRK